MDGSEILTFSAPAVEAAKVRATPSPTLELAYAYYFLGRPDSGRRAGELPWLELLHAKHPALVESLSGFWAGDFSTGCGYDVFGMVSELGYALDPGARRFLEDFDRLVEPTIALVKENQRRLAEKAKGDAHRADNAAKDQKMYNALLVRLEKLRDPDLRRRFAGLLSELWEVLEPLWEREGRAEAARAAEAFLQKYAETGNALDALPAHHFIQFESLAQHIRTSQEKGRLVIVPLYFASAGGFNFDYADAHYIGYGIQSERHHQKLAARAEAAAARIKAVADPTRLLLLLLITRYQGFEMTVSDFAAQLEVSQPTVSGHLKLLREAGLVKLEKKGNKALYSANPEALEAAVAEFQDLVSGKSR